MKVLTLAAGALALAAFVAEPAQATGITAGFHVGSAGHNVLQVTYGARTSIQRILWNLRQKGFHDFQNIDRWGHVYKITARGYRGNLVRITVNAYTGYVVDVAVLRNQQHNYGGYGSHGGGHGGSYWWGWRR